MLTTTEITTIIAQLNHVNANIRISTLKNLYDNVLKNDENISVFREASGISQTIKLLSDEHHLVRLGAVKLLFLLGINNEINQNIIRIEKAIPVIINLLSDNEMECRVTSAMALGGLALYHNNKLEIGKTDAIRLLLALLQEVDTEVNKQNVIGSIVNLIHMTDSNMEQAQLAGGIHIFISLLSSHDEKTQEYALAALWNLARTQKNKDIIRRAAGISSLVQLFSSKNARVNFNAAGTLLELSSSDLNKKAIFEADGINVFINHPFHDDDRRLYALKALAYLTEDLEKHERILSTNSIEKLSLLLIDHNQEIQKIANECLLNLGISRLNCADAVKSTDSYACTLINKHMLQPTPPADHKHIQRNSMMSYVVPVVAADEPDITHYHIDKDGIWEYQPPTHNFTNISSFNLHLQILQLTSKNNRIEKLSYSTGVCTSLIILLMLYGLQKILAKRRYTTVKIKLGDLHDSHNFFQQTSRESIKQKLEAKSWLFQK